MREMRDERVDGELLSSGLASDFGCLYDRHVRAVTAFMGSWIGEPDVVFELVAETFARALEHRLQYDESKGPAVASRAVSAEDRDRIPGRLRSEAKEASRLTRPRALLVLVQPGDRGDGRTRLAANAEEPAVVVVRWRASVGISGSVGLLGIASPRSDAILMRRSESAWAPARVCGAARVCRRSAVRACLLVLGLVPAVVGRGEHAAEPDDRQRERAAGSDPGVAPVKAAARGGGVRPDA
jgi:hypothetical protein